MNKKQMEDAALCEKMDNKGEYKDCSSCSCRVCIAQEEKKDDKNKMTITIKGENLECVRNTLIIINNKVYERGGNIIDYEREILKALLGVNWEERHIIGKQFIEEVS